MKLEKTIAQQKYLQWQGWTFNQQTASFNQFRYLQFFDWICKSYQFQY
jgi:hypothetical protein